MSWRSARLLVMFVFQGLFMLALANVRDLVSSRQADFGDWCLIWLVASTLGYDTFNDIVWPRDRRRPYGWRG